MGETAKDIITGVKWTSIQTIINRSFGFIIKIVLARILFPEDFGLIGMAVVFTSFIKVFTDLGFGAVLIQRKEESLNKEYFSTAFWTGVGWSVLIFLIVSFIIGPLTADLYDEPLLFYIVPALSLGILASPLNLVHRAQLIKSLSFKRLTVINNFSNITSGVIALVMAYYGAGVWALVFNSVANTFIAVPLFFKATGWTPQLVWKREYFQDLFGFGFFTTLSALVGKIMAQGDYFLIGKLLGKTELGLYSFGFILTDSIRAQVKSILNQVLYPIYSKFQSDKMKQEFIYSNNVFFNALLITPIMVTFILGVDIIPRIFGEKWVESTIIIQLVATSIIINGGSINITSVLRANNKVNIEFKFQLFKVLVLYLPMVYFGIIKYGIVGSAIAVVAFRLIELILDYSLMKIVLNFNVGQVLLEFIKGLAPSFLAAALIYLLMVSNVLKEALILKIVLLLILISVFTFFFYKNKIFYFLKLRKGDG